MRPLLLQILDSSIQSLPSFISRVPRLKTGSLICKEFTKPWVCKQCRQHSASPWKNFGHDDRRKRMDARDQWASPRGIRQQRTISSTERLKNADDSTKAKRKELPSQEEGKRSLLAKRFTHVMDNVQSNICIAGQRLNDLTGYSGIEALKKEIEEQEELVRTNRKALHKAKEKYTSAIAQRSASQREVNELLQRKHAWSPQDLERFTELYRSDHANEQAEFGAQEALLAVERAAEEATAKLAASILARYHEEQIWSDKIRRMSTWGTWGLMGVNVLLFLVFQIGVEPWRRKRLVKGFEEKVIEALEKEGAASKEATGAALAALQASHTVSTQNLTSDAETQTSASIPPNKSDAVDDVVLEEINPSTQILSSEPLAKFGAPWIDIAWYKRSIADLFSERQLTLRKADLTAARIEGIFAGIAFTGIIAAIIRAK